MSGTLPELAELALQIESAAARQEGMVEARGDTSGSPAPYERFLGHMRVTTGSGPVCIAERPSGILSITGGRDELSALASFFVFRSDVTPGAHNHYEYFSGNQYVAPESLPLVISLDSEHQ